MYGSRIENEKILTYARTVSMTPSERFCAMLQYHWTIPGKESENKNGNTLDLMAINFEHRICANSLADHKTSLLSDDSRLYSDGVINVHVSLKIQSNQMWLYSELNSANQSQ